MHLCWPQSQAPTRAGEVFFGCGGFEVVEIFQDEG